MIDHHCDAGAVIYQLSYQDNYVLVTLQVCNIPVDGNEYKWTYEISYIWTAEKEIRRHDYLIDHCSYERDSWKRYLFLSAVQIYCSVDEMLLLAY